MGYVPFRLEFQAHFRLVHGILFTAALAGLMVNDRALASADLNGTYDTGTLTPLERPVMYGNELFLSELEARSLETVSYTHLTLPTRLSV